MFAMAKTELDEADAWLETTGLLPQVAEGVAAYKANPDMVLDNMLDKVIGKFLDAWQERQPSCGRMHRLRPKPSPSAAPRVSRWI